MPLLSRPWGSTASPMNGKSLKFSPGVPPSCRLWSCSVHAQVVRPPQGSAVKFLRIGARIKLSPAEFSQFMQSMPSLTHVSIYSNIVRDITNHPTIGLPCLRSLVLHVESSLSVGVLLSLLDMHSLETLTIHGYHHNVTLAFAQHYQPYPSVHLLKIASTYNPAVPLTTTPSFHFTLPQCSRNRLLRWRGCHHFGLALSSAAGRQSTLPSVIHDCRYSYARSRSFMEKANVGQCQQSRRQSASVPISYLAGYTLLANTRVWVAHAATMAEKACCLGSARRQDYVAVGVCVGPEFGRRMAGRLLHQM